MGVWRLAFYQASTMKTRHNDRLPTLLRRIESAGEKAAISMIHAQAALLAAKMNTEIDLDAFSLLLKYRRQVVEENNHARIG
jgi:hypothetical protein